MENQSILNLDLDAVLFAHKNKEYGAYTLRKSYEMILSSVVLFVIVFFILVTSGTLIYSLVFGEKDNSIYTRRIVEVLQLSEPPSIDVNKQVKPPEIKTTKSADKLTAPVVKSD